MDDINRPSQKGEPHFATKQKNTIVNIYEKPEFLDKITTNESLQSKDNVNKKWVICFKNSLTKIYLLFYQKGIKKDF